MLTVIANPTTLSTVSILDNPRVFPTKGSQLFASAGGKLCEAFLIRRRRERSLILPIPVFLKCALAVAIPVLAVYRAVVKVFYLIDIEHVEL